MSASRGARGWRLVLGAGGGLGVGDVGARNMAVDHALFESVQDGGRPVLRLYCWRPACLSFGRNQHAVGVYDPARAATAGIGVVRRPTGGLAVLHDRELTYSVLAPLELFGGPRAAYTAINDAVAAGLRALGVDAWVALDGGARDPRREAAEPCFQKPAAGEIVAAGRKLVGSAQRCERRCLLQHGSILLAGSQTAVLDLLIRSAVEVRPPRSAPAPAGSGAITLGELLGGAPAPRTVADCLVGAFTDRFGTSLAPEPLAGEERARADALETWYAAAHWTWRR